MAQDHSDNSSTTSTPPDQGAQGDVSTTGHSSHDTAGAADAHAGDAHGGGHGGHGDSPDVSTLVPTSWRQLLLPVIILVIVLILVAPPILNAFASRPASPPPAQLTPAPGGGNAVPNTGILGQSTKGSAAKAATPTVAVLGLAETPTAPSIAGITAAPISAPAATAAIVVVPPVGLDATQTAVAVAGEQGVVARVPVAINFEGTDFVIKPGNTLLPDWKPSPDVGIATWIDGTVANHILYIPFSDANQALFSSAKQGDKIRLTMNTGQIFEFAINRAERATNGPPDHNGQFTVNTAMAQDHAGVTLFLIGDPAADRAVVQADFTGNIQ